MVLRMDSVFSGLLVMMSLESMLVTSDGSVGNDASGHRTFIFLICMLHYDANLSLPSSSLT